MEIFYGCHSWKGHDVSEFQLRQPLTIISKHMYKLFNKRKKSNPNGCLGKKTFPTLLQIVNEALRHIMETRPFDKTARARQPKPPKPIPRTRRMQHAQETDPNQPARTALPKGRTVVCITAIHGTNGSTSLQDTRYNCNK